MRKKQQVYRKRQHNNTIPQCAEKASALSSSAQKHTGTVRGIMSCLKVRESIEYNIHNRTIIKSAVRESGREE